MTRWARGVLAAKVLELALLAPVMASARSGPTVAGLCAGPVVLGSLDHRVWELACAPTAGLMLGMPRILAQVQTNSGPSGAWSGDTYTPQSGVFTVAGTLKGSTVSLGSQATYPYLGSGGPTSSLDLFANTTDGASALGLTFNQVTAFATVGAKLFQLKNGGTEKFSVKWDTGIVLSGSAGPATTDTGISSNGAGLDLIANVGSGRSYFFRVAGSNVDQITSAGVFVLVASNQMGFAVNGGAGVYGYSDDGGYPTLVANNITVGRGGIVRTPSTATWTSATGGQFEVSHLAGISGAPTSPTAGTGCGTSSSPTVTGNDMDGQIGVTCGSAGTAGNNFVTATFAHAYITNAPVCTISCANAATCAGTVLSDHMANPTTTNIAVSCAGGTCTTGTLLWNYHCAQR